MTKQTAGTKTANLEMTDGNGLYSPGGWGFECGVLPPVAFTPERKLEAKGPYQQTGARARTRQHMSTKTNPIVLYNERPTRQAGSSNQLRRLSEINIT
jgi:hypothetical protein